jgi:hypothetical protein
MWCVCVCVLEKNQSEWQRNTICGTGVNSWHFAMVNFILPSAQHKVWWWSSKEIDFRLRMKNYNHLTSDSHIQGQRTTGVGHWVLSSSDCDCWQQKILRFYGSLRHELFCVSFPCLPCSVPLTFDSVLLRLWGDWSDWWWYREPG